ncbi:hypothetical protein K7X08_023432 [Anisodus acutangulus]|uniref:Transcription factor CBF/NF-Y/archaeal histone domain-containing protein n=1 Tax=Anisodus acutangulus TaxID=402998 RepID=A0A9Q1R2P5_9SOLA|nr:hypothetical protein K7X08_023432 [Anisodus acutangulus]
MVDNINIVGSKYNRESFNYNSISEDRVFKEQDRLLPIANVGRIMKQILPPNAKISKEAKEIMQECVSEFISFVTGEASDKCHNEKRKTLNGDDICLALERLGFDDYVEPLKRLLPIANVGRIMKQILPPNAKISKEAKETMQECVSEFINFVTGEASFKCHNEKRKTLNGDDSCWALERLGFDDYVEPLKRCLHKQRGRVTM